MLSANHSVHPALNPALNPAHAWEQVLARDARAEFVYAVSSTGIFCRPSCPSRRPAARNVVFFHTAADALAAGFRPCRRCSPAGRSKDAALATRLCAYMAEHRDRKVTLGELARVAHTSAFTLQRKFRRTVGVSARVYQSQVRSNALRSALSTTTPVTEAIYQAGYSSSSRVYESAATALGMSPGRFRNGGAGETIRYTIVDSPLGMLLVAATGRGLCSVMLGDAPAALEAELRTCFPNATLTRDDGELTEYVGAILDRMRSQPSARSLPLDIQATAFQARVWQALERIPRGQTRSYSALAAELGHPRAVRAVARACAMNPVAVAIPCHRVVGSNGTLTGYRWGVARKQQLLDVEAAGAEAAAPSKS